MGRLGNQMCEYAMGRIIAEKKGHQLEFYNHNEANNPTLVNRCFPNAIPLINGNRVTTNILTVGLACPSPHNTFQHLDVDAMIKHQGLVYLNGYWQKHYYFTPHADKIKKWFEYDDSTHTKPNSDDIVVYVRLGDYLTENWYLAPQIYIDIVNKMGSYNRCIIQTDSPEAPILNEFKCLKNVVINKGNCMSDFSILKYAKRLVLSQSSFGFWAAFLGNQDVVYVPVNIDRTKPWWSSEPLIDDIDLVPNENKYIKVKI